MMDKNREAFEAFIADHLCHTLNFIQKSRSSTGSYYKDYIQDAWIYWQASRQAFEVELKQFDEFQICHYGASEDYAKGYIDAQNNANKAITSHGIRIKGKTE